jgi:hypothetical protein
LSIGIFKNIQQEQDIPYTGADSPFYSLTTSKPVQKRLFIQNNIPTSPFVGIESDSLDADIQ